MECWQRHWRGLVRRLGPQLPRLPLQALLLSCSEAHDPARGQGTLLSPGFHHATPRHPFPPPWPGHLNPVCCSLLCPAASLPTPEQNFQIIRHEYSHYQRWKRSEVVLNQSEACTLETQPDYSACILPSSPSEGSFRRRTSPLYPSTIWSNTKASLKRLERSNLGGV